MSCCYTSSTIYWMNSLRTAAHPPPIKELYIASINLSHTVQNIGLKTQYLVGYPTPQNCLQHRFNTLHITLSRVFLIGEKNNLTSYRKNLGAKAFLFPACISHFLFNYLLFQAIHEKRSISTLAHLMELFNTPWAPSFYTTLNQKNDITLKTQLEQILP